MAQSEVIFFSNACQNNAKYRGLLFFEEISVLSTIAKRKDFAKTIQ
jgi:hypothetical protein